MLDTICYNCLWVRRKASTLGQTPGVGGEFRLLTADIVALLKSIRHHEYRFSFDAPESVNAVERAITLLQDNGIKRCMWFVLCGFDTTFQEDLFRLNYVRQRNQVAFVQRYRRNGTKPDARLTALARWANQHDIFRGMTWEQFCEHPDNKPYRQFLANPKSTDSA